MCTKNQLTYILQRVAGTAKSVFGDKYDSTLLYGSYARGDYDSESDIDIMVLADVEREELASYKKPLIALTSELGLEHDIVITVTLKDTETFNKYLGTVPFYDAVKKEGIPIAV
ncbi:MAG: nucleotidyltransferase domain-containing protein [Clostridia bacterium]|nr:nucleotidyltransferase domain-containing protein [Clostridia bacterium]